MIKLIDVIFEEQQSWRDKLVPKDIEVRRQKQIQAAKKVVQSYIENGSKGDLDLSKMAITSLPNGLEVEGHLDLTGTPITSLPDGLKVGGSLDLSYTPIISLPDGLEVGGNFNLIDTSITTLPDGLKVGGNLYLNGTSITSLPDGLEVGGNLYLSRSKITSLPDGLKVGGGLYLDNTPNISLPDGLKVRDTLYLYRSKITSLPDGLEIGGNLHLTGTPITSLPSSLKVGNVLWIHNTPLSKKYTKDEILQMAPGVKLIGTRSKKYLNEQENWRDKLIPKDIEVRQKKLTQSEYAKLLDYIKNQSTESNLHIHYSVPSFPKQITKVSSLEITNQGNRMDLSNIKEIKGLNIRNVNDVILPQEVKNNVYISTVGKNLNIPKNFKCNQITFANVPNDLDLSTLQIESLTLFETSQVTLPNKEIQGLIIRSTGKLIIPPNFSCKSLRFVENDKSKPTDYSYLYKVLKGRYDILIGNTVIKEPLDEFPKDLVRLENLEIENQKNHLDLSNIQKINHLSLLDVQSVKLPRVVSEHIKLTNVDNLTFSEKLECSSLSIVNFSKPVDLSLVERIDTGLYLTNTPEVVLPNCVVKQVLLKNVNKIIPSPNFKCKELNIHNWKNEQEVADILKQLLPRVENVDIGVNSYDINTVNKFGIPKQFYDKVEISGKPISNFLEVISLSDIQWKVHGTTFTKIKKIGNISKEDFLKLPTTKFDYVVKLPVKSVEVFNVFGMGRFTDSYMVEATTYIVHFENTEKTLKLIPSYYFIEFDGKEFKSLSNFYKEFTSKYVDSSTSNTSKSVTKTPKLRTLVDASNETVSLNLGRKRRAGYGIKGNYKEYVSSFHINTQNNLERIENIFNVKWEDFIAFENNSSINFVITGKLPNGDPIYYDNFGYGMGMKSSLFDKDFKEIPKNQWGRY